MGDIFNVTVTHSTKSSPSTIKISKSRQMKSLFILHVLIKIFLTFVFLVIESLPNQFWDRIFSFLQIKNTSKVELNQQDDEDVIEEE